MVDELVPEPFTSLDRNVRRLVSEATSDSVLTGIAAQLQKVCRAAVQALWLRGSAIHVASATGESGVVAASDSGGSRLADLAFTVGEGPSVDAFTLRRPVLVSDLAPSRRWPGFSSTAQEAGLSGIFSLPLQIGGVTLGVLDLYAGQLRPLTEDDVPLALSFARLAGLTLLGEQPTNGDGTWEPLLDHRAEVHQAQGMVMVDLGVALAEASLRMRAHAFSMGIPLIELAHEIIGGRLLPAEVGES